jgi:hypothetical protein
MNKQNFTRKFSYISEEERQNQSGEMNGGERETFWGGKRATHCTFSLKVPLSQMIHYALKMRLDSTHCVPNRNCLSFNNWFKISWSPDCGTHVVH